MGTRNVHGLTFDGARWHSRKETVAAEAVLHVRINGIPYTTTVCTPADSIALVRGLLYTEGILTDSLPLDDYRLISDPETGYPACVEVHVPGERMSKPLAHRRSAMISASCGICGTREPEDLALYGPPLNGTVRQPISPEALHAMMQRMRDAQHVFHESGGTHAAALFRAGGEVMACFEDIGRHNAVDKAIGHVLQHGMPLDAFVLCVSGRISYEIVFKAYRARVPVVCGVSAPSSLAVDMAERFGLTLVAFCRAPRLCVFSHTHRVCSASPDLNDTSFLIEEP